MKRGTEERRGADERSEGRSREGETECVTECQKKNVHKENH